MRHVHPRLLAGRLPSHSVPAQAVLSARLGHARVRVPAGPRRGPRRDRAGRERLRRRRVPLRLRRPRHGRPGAHSSHRRDRRRRRVRNAALRPGPEGRPPRGREPPHARLRGAGALVRRPRRRGRRPRRAVRGHAGPPSAPARAERARGQGRPLPSTERLAALVPAMRRPAAVERRFGSRKEIERSRAPRARHPELLEQAAEASRTGLRTRRDRIATGARPILHSAIAAALAWLVATEVIGHEQPFFAPISAVITLGLTVGERRRRAVEIAIGVAVGIAIADALVAAIGTGAWQIGAVVALAMVAATLVGGGPLLASQAAASAVLVATLQPPDGAFDFTRAVDAATGATIGLLVGSVLLPVDPLRLVRKDLGPVIDGLSA